MKDLYTSKNLLAGAHFWVSCQLHSSLGNDGALFSFLPSGQIFSMIRGCRWIRYFKPLQLKIIGGPTLVHPWNDANSSGPVIRTLPRWLHEHTLHLYNLLGSSIDYRIFDHLKLPASLEVVVISPRPMSFQPESCHKKNKVNSCKIL